MFEPIYTQEEFEDRTAEFQLQWIDQYEARVIAAAVKESTKRFREFCALFVEEAVIAINEKVDAMSPANDRDAGKIDGMREALKLFYQAADDVRMRVERE